MPSHSALIERIYNDVRTSLIELYGGLLERHNMDYNMATRLSKANPELIASLWDNHLPVVAKFVDRPEFLDCTPRQFPLIFTRHLLTSRGEEFEAAILSLHPSGRQFYERIYQMFIQTGAEQPFTIPETFWDSVIAFDNDEAGRQLMKSDLKHAFQLEALPVLEKGMAHLREQIKEAYVKAFLKVAGPEFQDIGIGKDGSLGFWISFPRHLYSTLKRSPQEAMWLALNPSLFEVQSISPSKPLTPRISLWGLRRKCLLDHQLDELERTLFGLVFFDYPSSFEALLNGMTLEEVRQLATMEDKHLLLTTIMDNPTVFPPADAKKKARDVAEYNGLYFTKLSILNGITSKPYSTILAIVRDSKNVQNMIEKCLKPTEESMELFRKRNATEMEDNQDKCSICLGGFDDEHPARAPKGCAHFYHQECIAEYCQEKTDATCPVCRAAVKPKRPRKKHEK